MKKTLTNCGLGIVYPAFSVALYSVMVSVLPSFIVTVKTAFTRYVPLERLSTEPLSEMLLPLAVLVHFAPLTAD